MLDNQDSIFDIPHSIPSSAHLAAVSNRTPSGTSKVITSKYMPDYGGFLEVPGCKIKQNGLKIGIPFHVLPYYVRVTISEPDIASRHVPTNPNCLVALSYLQTDSYYDLYEASKSFTTIRAVGSELYFDIIKAIRLDDFYNVPNTHEFSTYAHVPYSSKISGLKYCDYMENFVIVKFEKGIKLVKLNETYKIPPKTQPRYYEEIDSDETDVESSPTPFPNRSAISSIQSFAEKKGIQTIDASLSKSNRWMYIASNDSKELYVKLFDLNKSAQCYGVLTKVRDDDVKIRTDIARKSMADRKRSLRSFIPSKPSYEKLHQIECDPSHLLNSLMTTSNRVALIDPRSKTIAHDYANKFELDSVSPTEQFKQIEFSKKNDQQIYLMSNEKFRAIDRRFLSKDLNCLDHMLDPASYDMMNMKIVYPNNGDIETLCLSSFGRICFISFDQSEHSYSNFESSGKLVNPRSIHAPFHEPGPVDISGKREDELYGLAVASNMIFDSKKVSFSVLQMAQDGDVCIRGFPVPRDDFLRFDYPSITMPKSKRSIKRTLSRDQPARERETIERLDSRACSSSPASNQLNILDSKYVLEAEQQLTTKRSRLKYEWMKRVLERKP